jgi:CMP-2-keto-3-deoxyoctulosonic acid synthetase
MNVLCVIPARYASTRLPGKPLADIAGKPMIQRVYERASQANVPNAVLVATDHPLVEEAVKKFGGIVMMTSPDHPTGTDRLAELTERAAANLEDGSLVVISGGLMAYKDILVEQIKSKVHKKLKYVVPELPQIYGAAVLCAKLCGFTGNMFLKNFNNDYKKIIHKKR